MCLDCLVTDISYAHLILSFFSQDDPNPVVAMDHVVPMTGYYCKVCHKFYHNEVMAKVTHCRSKPHSAKYEVIFVFLGFFLGGGGKGDRSVIEVEGRIWCTSFHPILFVFFFF